MAVSASKRMQRAHASPILACRTCILHTVGSHPTGCVEGAELLLRAGSSVASPCDGCPPLVMAVCIATLQHRQVAAVQLARLLLDAGADPYQR